MKRLMIVDDEVLVRIGIKSMARWEQYGYTVVCDAEDGEEAWEKAKEFHPDIVLTDLKMSPRDGFWLMEQCQREYPNMKFIVLSNYNDFDNVRKAMKMGACDYIFKLTVKTEELLKVLDEVSKELPIKQEKAEHLYQTAENRTVIKNSLMKQALSEEQAFLTKTEKKLRELSLKIDFSKQYFLVSIRINNYQVIQRQEDFLEKDLLIFAMTNMIEEIWQKELEAEIFHEEDSRFLIIVQDKPGGRTASEKAFHTLVQSVRQYYGLEISGSVSASGQGFSWLRQGWNQNQQTLEELFYDGPGKLGFYSEKEQEKMNLPDYLRTVVFEQFLEQEDFGQAEAYCKELMEFLEQKKYAPQDVRKKLKRLHSLMIIYLERHEIRGASICDRRGGLLEETADIYDFFQDLKQAEMDLMRSYAQVFEEQKRERGRYSQRIELVKQYVKMNLSEDLSVSSAAALSNMSESHFSHVFKNEEGVSYTEYINTCRMEKATILLKNTDMLVSEIAEKIGIDNPNYFSAQYKKRTGKSPSEFRRMLTEKYKQNLKDCQQDLKDSKDHRI